MEIEKYKRFVRGHTKSYKLLRKLNEMMLQKFQKIYILFLFFALLPQDTKGSVDKDYFGKQDLPRKLRQEKLVSK
jgi:hypothetical protein